MSTFLTSCGRSCYPPEAQRKSALIMIASSLGLVLGYLALTAVFGKGLLSEALLYSTFNIALVLSSLPTFLKNYPRKVRLSLVVLGLGTSYGFFLGVALLADRF